MPSPFPGMDPYLEAPELWPDFHHELISAILERMNLLLRPAYHSKVEDKVFPRKAEKAFYCNSVAWNVALQADKTFCMTVSACSPVSVSVSLLKCKLSRTRFLPSPSFLVSR